MSKDDFARDQLKSFVERIERLEEEKKALTTDINEVYAEAKANGFDTKILKKVVKLRAMDEAERAEEAALVDLYMQALGMTPLESAIEKAKLRDAVKGMGEPVELTEDEKAGGAFAAFRMKDGARSTLSSPSVASASAQ